MWLVSIFKTPSLAAYFLPIAFGYPITRFVILLSAYAVHRQAIFAIRLKCVPATLETHLLVNIDLCAEQYVVVLHLA